VTIQPATLALSTADRPSPAGPRRDAAAPADPYQARQLFEADLIRVYHEQFPRLFRYLDRLSGDAQLAADVAQEAFVRLFDRGAMPNEAGAWLITVAANLLRDDRRRAGRRLRLLEATADSVPVAAAPDDPAGALDREERRGLVRSALARLTPRDREALLLRHSGYSYREIGAVLELAETSVGTILLRAGAVFRSAYEEMHGAPD
jgi:RNA polymerase sigma factor (sigma-70 family)